MIIWLLASALAADPAAEMERLLQAEDWAGAVSHYYAEGGETPSEPMVLGAATALLRQGDAMAAWQLLRSAQVGREMSSARAAQDEIEESYGRVILKARGDAVLAHQAPPSDPALAAALATATQRLADVKLFDGLLPLGDYTFGSVTFTLQPRQRPVEVTGRPVRGNKVKPASAATSADAPATTSSGLRLGPYAGLGLGVSASPQPLLDVVGDAAEPHVGDVGGFTVALRGGADAWLGPVGLHLGAIGQGMVSGSALHHLGFRLGLLAHPGNVRVELGGAAGWYLGAGTGLADWFSSDGAPAPDTIGWTAQSPVLGLYAGAGLDLVEVGGRWLAPVVDVSWHADADRPYVAATLGLSWR